MKKLTSSQTVKINKAEQRKANEAVHEAITRECARISAQPKTLNELIDSVGRSSDRELQDRLDAKGIVGYSNTSPGDQSTTIIEVEEFTKDQMTIRRRATELRQIIEEGRAAGLVLGVLQRECDHTVFADTEGFPYNTRACLICGDSMGLV